MSRWAVWQGIEVEGRLYGVDTLFVFAETEELEALFETKPHVFFCSNFVAPKHYPWVCKALDLGCLVTVELTPEQLIGLPDRLVEDCTLMVVIDAPWTEKLKPHDQVRLTQKPFNTETYVWGQGARTAPDDYIHDAPVSLSPDGLAHIAGGEHQDENLG